MTTAASYCRSCGKALNDENRLAPDAIYCSACAPAAGPPKPAASAPPPLAPQATGISPGLAFLLGLIPGVGAIYNGQYAKGLIHVVVFGLLVSIVSSDNVTGEMTPLFAMMIPIWVMYMAFEAYHTAQRRLNGQIVDEFSSLVPLQGQQRFPAAPILLIAVGILFLLHNLEIVRIGQLLRFWPVTLIGLGAYMLYVRLSGSTATAAAPSQESSHE
ncbi:MAG: hypothetical protein JJE04_04445 [Acidobacteriia bacterium]|nr:hypothetical protein [Terriglobia bacterium]